MAVSNQFRPTLSYTPLDDQGGKTPLQLAQSSDDAWKLSPDKAAGKDFTQVTTSLPILDIDLDC